jgi:hypothetical protein
MVAGPVKCGSKSLLFIRNHVSIESGFSLLRVKPLSEYGLGNMTLSVRPGMFVGFMYHVNLSNNFSLRFGEIMGVNAFRFDFDPGKNDTASYMPVHMSMVKPYLSIPLEFCARMLVKRRHILGLVVGASANLFASEKLTANSRLSSNPNSQEMYTMRFNYARPNPFMNLVAGIEYMWVLNNLNMVSFTLRYSAGLRPIFYAQYQHRENDLIISSGSFNSFNDYVSLSVGYVFTRVNKLRDK